VRELWAHLRRADGLWETDVVVIARLTRERDMEDARVRVIRVEQDTAVAAMGIDAASSFLVG